MNALDYAEFCLAQIEKHGDMRAQIERVIAIAVNEQKARDAKIVLEFGLPSVGTKEIARRIKTNWARVENEGAEVQS